MKQKAKHAGMQGFAPIIVILPVVAFLAVFIFLIFKSVKTKIPNALPTPTPIASGGATPVAANPPDWETYTNEKFGFEMQYPKEFKYQDNGPYQATASAPLTLGTISFTDSNKHTFSVNVYAPSGDPSVNTNVNNLQEYSGYCGTQFATRTIVNKILTENGLAYKEVAQVDPKGRSLTDFCFFSPAGNLIVLRNNIDSTVIAMKHIISTFRFTSQ